MPKIIAKRSSSPVVLNQGGETITVTVPTPVLEFERRASDYVFAVPSKYYSPFSLSYLTRARYGVEFQLDDNAVVDRPVTGNDWTYTLSGLTSGATHTVRARYYELTEGEKTYGAWTSKTFTVEPDIDNQWRFDDLGQTLDSGSADDTLVLDYARNATDAFNSAPNAWSPHGAFVNGSKAVSIPQWFDPSVGFRWTFRVFMETAGIRFSFVGEGGDTIEDWVRIGTDGTDGSKLMVNFYASSNQTFTSAEDIFSDGVAQTVTIDFQSDGSDYKVRAWANVNGVVTRLTMSDGVDDVLDAVDVPDDSTMNTAYLLSRARNATRDHGFEGVVSWAEHSAPLSTVDAEALAQVRAIHNRIEAKTSVREFVIRDVGHGVNTPATPSGANVVSISSGTPSASIISTLESPAGGVDTVVFESGVHRITDWAADIDVDAGISKVFFEDGAHLQRSVSLSSPTVGSGVWSYDVSAYPSSDQYNEHTVTGTDTWGERVFIDGVELYPVGTVGEVTSGTYHLSRDGADLDTLTIGDDPSGADVELALATGSAQYAIKFPQDCEVVNASIRYWAGENRRYTVWLSEGCSFSGDLVGTLGFRFEADVTVSNARIHNSAVTHFRTGGNPNITIEDFEMVAGNTKQYDDAWEAGNKFDTGSKNCVVRRGLIAGDKHDHTQRQFGYALWVDNTRKLTDGYTMPEILDTGGYLFEDLLMFGFSRGGLHYEISTGGQTIMRRCIAMNCDVHGFYISSSSHTLKYHCDALFCGNGHYIAQKCRDKPPEQQQIRDNITMLCSVRQTQGVDGGKGYIMGIFVETACDSYDGFLQENVDWVLPMENNLFFAYEVRSENTAARFKSYDATRDNVTHATWVSRGQGESSNYVEV